MGKKKLKLEELEQASLFSVYNTILAVPNLPPSVDLSIQLGRLIVVLSLSVTV